MPPKRRTGAAARPLIKETVLEMVEPDGGGLDAAPEHNSVLLSVNIESVPAKRQKSQMRTITDKISQALDDMHQMYDAGSQDILLNDVAEKVDSLEGGELKFQLKEFIQRYKDMSSYMEEVATDRDQVLESLADWFTADHMQLDNLMTSHDDDPDEGQHAFREGLLNAKLGFEKLKALNSQIVEISTSGADTQHLERERMSLQKQVMNDMKEFRAATPEPPPPEPEDKMSKAWQYAADEVCDLLHKVRDQGTSYMAELEQKVSSMMKELETQAKVARKMETELVEQKAMVKRWQIDNNNLTSEKAKFEARCRKMKKEMKDMKTAMTQLHQAHILQTQGGQVAPLPLPEMMTHSSDDEEDDDKFYRWTPRAPPPTLVTDGGDQTMLKTQLKDSKRQIDTLTKEKMKLEWQVEDLVSALEEREDLVEKMQYDKTELMRQMKQNSLRPNMKRMSCVGPPAPLTRPSVALTPSGHAIFGGIVTGLSVKASQDKVRNQLPSGSVKCPKCGENVSVDGATEAGNTSLSGGSINVDGTTSGDAVNQDKITSNTTMAESNLTLTQTSSLTVAIKLKEDEVGTLQNRLAEFRGKVLKLQEQLTKSQGEIDNLRSSKLSSQSVAADMLILDLVDGVDVSYASKGVQTEEPEQDYLALDFMADKLNEWTAPQPVQTQMQARELHNEMLTGAEPASVKHAANKATKELQKELGRMLTMFRHYMDQVDSLMHNEGCQMAAANKQLRTVLPSYEQGRLDSFMKSVMKDGLLDAYGRVPDMGHLDSIGLTGWPPEQGALHAITMGAENQGSSQVATPSVSDDVMGHLHDIRKFTVEAIRQTFQLVYAFLHSQHRQYEHTVGILGKPPNLSHGGADIQSDFAPEVTTKRSRSQSDVSRGSQKTAPNMITDGGMFSDYYKTGRSGEQLSTPRTAPHIPWNTTGYHHHGHGSFQATLSGQTVTAGAMHDSRTPHQQQQETIQDRKETSPVNRAEMNITRATVPKRGMIKVVAAGDDMPGSTEKKMPKRKTRPMPISYKKLMMRQKQMLNNSPSTKPRKGKGRSTTPAQEGQGHQRVSRSGFNELLDVFFQGYNTTDSGRHTQNVPSTRTNTGNSNSMFPRAGSDSRDYPAPSSQYARMESRLPPLFF